MFMLMSSWSFSWDGRKISFCCEEGWLIYGPLLLIQIFFCVVYEYVGKANIDKCHWNPNFKKIGVAMPPGIGAGKFWKEPLRGTKILSCGRGMKIFSPPRGTKVWVLIRQN